MKRAWLGSLCLLAWACGEDAASPAPDPLDQGVIDAYAAPPIVRDSGPSPDLLRCATDEALIEGRCVPLSGADQGIRPRDLGVEGADAVIEGADAVIEGADAVIEGQDQGADAVIEGQDQGVDKDAGLDQGVDEGIDGGATGCGAPLDPDRARIVLVAHPFSDDPEVPGAEISLIELPVEGDTARILSRVDLGARVARMTFMPSGRLALISTEDGALHSFDPARAQVLDTLQVDEVGASDLVAHPDDERVFVVTHNVTEASGVFTARVDCEGRLSLDPAHLGLRLCPAMALLPQDPSRALLLGGQAGFAPADSRDLRLLRWEAGRWIEEGAFDIWGDFVSTTGIAISPDGRAALIPNGSPFSDEGAQVLVVGIEGDQLRALGRLTGMEDAMQARFAPEGTGLVTLGEPGRLVVITEEGGAWAERTRISGVGLADQLGIVRTGRGRGLILAPAIDPRQGARLVVLRELGYGAVETVLIFPLGEGLTAIPGAVAVAP
ncbi:hypothetical protein KKB55_21385 [Myxococcota bacterium]|nr:hypothetical protein [Myxococcota bacterium]